MRVCKGNITSTPPAGKSMPTGDPSRQTRTASPAEKLPLPPFGLFLLGLCTLIGTSFLSARAVLPQTNRSIPPAAGHFPSDMAPACAVEGTPVYSYTVVNTYPHDPNAFTQGLVFTDSVLYEGTGLYGESSLRRVELETGEVLQIYELPGGYFGEGIAVYSDTIFQLTWRENVAFLYDKETFGFLDQFAYPTEGWGLTHDGQQLIMSDGTSTLYFRDPQTFSETGRIQVYDEYGPVTRLNELEYIHGEVYANVWVTDRIARIDPQTGQVTAWIDLTGLRPPGAGVLNGIAYDAVNNRLFVTGKRWPELFEIELHLPHWAYLPLMPRGWDGAPPSTPTPSPPPVP